MSEQFNQSIHAFDTVDTGEELIVVAQADHGHDEEAIEIEARHPSAVDAGEHAEDTHGHGDADAHGDAHGEVHEATEYLMPHEVPNLATLIEAAVTKPGVHDGVRPHPHALFFINPLFSIFYCVVLIYFVRKFLRGASVRRPGLGQNIVESVFGGLRAFFVNIMGTKFEKHVPFIISLWIFIWLNNVMVLVPFLKSPNSSVWTTLALAIVTMIYVRWQNIKELGFGGYLHHLAGSPNSALMWALAPLFFFLELLGELIKPLSLALRLFGNIFGEDKLLAVFLGLGMMLVAAFGGGPAPLVGIPLHLPFFFMVLLLSTIQAFVFTLLASIYLQLMEPHEHHHAEEHLEEDEGMQSAAPAATV